MGLIFLSVMILGMLSTVVGHKHFVVQCNQIGIVPWRPWQQIFESPADVGTKCNVLCPVNCSCSLAEYAEVIAHCSSDDNQVAYIPYMDNSSYLSWEGSRLYNISKKSFSGLADILEELYLINNNLTSLSPHVFEYLHKLILLDLKQNFLEHIDSKIFSGLNNLKWLGLVGNRLMSLQPGSFESVRQLEWLFLDKNSLYDIQVGVLDELKNLTFLSIRNNKLQELHSGVINSYRNRVTLSLHGNVLKEIKLDTFNKTENLISLVLSHNLLTYIPVGLLNGLKILETLYLHNNMLIKMESTAFRKLTNLETLTLFNNQLSSLHPEIFKDLKSLQELYLSNNLLEVLPENIFRSLTKLRYLDMSGNYLNEMGFQPFQSCATLQEIYVTQNPLHWISDDTFDGLNLTSHVYVDIAASCCFIKTAHCISNSTKSPFLTCERLLPYDVLRGGIWVISVFSIVNNIISILIKCKGKHEINQIQFVLIINLSISDLLMGVYLIMLLSVDLYYQDYFPSHSDMWRNSSLCKIAGSISVLSSEASVFFITLISIDRFLRVKFPFGRYWLTVKSATRFVFFLWLLAFSISLASFLLSGMVSDAYAMSEICVGLPISRQRIYNQSEKSTKTGYIYGSNNDILLENTSTGSKSSMYFSIAIFTALNMGCFFIVGLCYMTIFMMLRLSAKKSGSSISKNEIRMAKKVFLLVLTDFCCWVPIGVLSILVQAGAVDVSPAAYAWIATFILPINSCINPFLYTLGDVITEKISCKKCERQDSEDYVKMRHMSRAKTLQTSQIK